MRYLIFLTRYTVRISMTGWKAILIVWAGPIHLLLTTLPNVRLHQNYLSRFSLAGRFQLGIRREAYRAPRE